MFLLRISVQLPICSVIQKSAYHYNVWAAIRYSQNNVLFSNCQIRQYQKVHNIHDIPQVLKPPVPLTTTQCHHIPCCIHAYSHNLLPSPDGTHISLTDCRDTKKITINRWVTICNKGFLRHDFILN
jgi:hypothetical protein